MAVQSRKIASFQMKNRHMDVIFRTSFSELVQFCASALLSGGKVSDVFRFFFLDLARTKTRQAKRIARMRVSLLTSVDCALEFGSQGVRAFGRSWVREFPTSMALQWKSVRLRSSEVR